MADVVASLPIESRSASKPVKISKDLNANAVGNEVFVRLADGVDSQDFVVINSAYGATPTAVPIAGKYEATPTTYTDGDATPFLTDANGKLEVVATLAGGGSGGTSAVDDSAFTVATDRVTPVAGIHRTVADSVDDGDTGALWMSVDRRLYVQPFDGTNAMPMQDAVGRAGYQQITDGTNTMPTMDVNTRAGFVQITDGVEDWSIDASGFGQVDIAAQSLTALKISKDANANTETNPIYVQTVDGTVSGIEIVDYNTAASVAAAGTSNHDYTVTTAKTSKLHQVECTASGSVKIEVQNGPVAGLVSRMVGFTSMANPVFNFDFKGLLETPDTSTGTVRLIRTNREDVAMDVYSTLIMTEI